jgi:hypothetical protein
VNCTVEEAANKVRVAVLSERGPDPDDWALQVTRTIDEPLDDRPVIDTSRDEAITQPYDITTGS